MRDPLRGVRWMQPAAGLLNLTLAIWNYCRHVPWWLISINLGSAAFSFAMWIVGYYRLRELQAARARLRQLQRAALAEAYGMTDEEMQQAERDAYTNLEKVMKATGATWGIDGACLTIGEWTYVVGESFVRRSSKRTGMWRASYYWEQPSETCYQVSGIMPAYERIATALLFLKRDPAIFERWRDNHGNWDVPN